MGTCRWANAAELMAIVKRVGKALIEAQPLELVIGNIVRRILFIIREEHANKLKELRAREPSFTESDVSLAKPTAVFSWIIISFHLTSHVYICTVAKNWSYLNG